MATGHHLDRCGQRQPACRSADRQEPALRVPRRRLGGRRLPARLAPARRASGSSWPCGPGWFRLPACQCARQTARMPGPSPIAAKGATYPDRW